MDPPLTGVSGKGDRPPRTPVNTDPLTEARSRKRLMERTTYVTIDPSNFQGVVQQLPGFHTRPVDFSRPAMLASPSSSSAESERGRADDAGESTKCHGADSIDLTENAPGPSDPSTLAVNPPVSLSNEDVNLTSYPFNVERDSSLFRMPEPRSLTLDPSNFQRPLQLLRGRAEDAGESTKYHGADSIDLTENAPGPSDPSTLAVNPPVSLSNEDVNLTSYPFNVERDSSLFGMPVSTSLTLGPSNFQRPLQLLRGRAEDAGESTKYHGADSIDLTENAPGPSDPSTLAVNPPVSLSNEDVNLTSYPFNVERDSSLFGMPVSTSLTLGPSNFQRPLQLLRGRADDAGESTKYHGADSIDLTENAPGPSDPSTLSVNPPVSLSNEDVNLTSYPFNVERDSSLFGMPVSTSLTLGPSNFQRPLQLLRGRADDAGESTKYHGADSIDLTENAPGPSDPSTLSVNPPVSLSNELPLNQASDLSCYGLIGVERKVTELENLLQVEVNDIRIVGIYGVGGIGKTILAKLVFDRVSTHFAGCSFLQDTREITRQHGGLEILQTKLMSEILMRECTHIGASEDGICFIKEVLCDMRVVIVLDNVDSGFCLNRFVGEVDSFGPGSRIIFTAKRKNDLPKCTETYEVPKMNDQEAFQLFTYHASKGRTSSRVDRCLSSHVFDQKILCAIGRIPLSIEIIGSLLSEEPVEEWGSTLDKFKDIPDEELQKRLKVSYDALSDQERQIFLDMACFINGEDSRISSYIWHDSDGGMIVCEGPKRLLSLSLVKVGANNELLMHDELRELGRELASQEEFSETKQMNKFFIQVRDFDALLAEKDLEKVEALNLCFDKRSQYQDTDFQKMPSLRFLKMGDANMCGDFSDVFINLRWLHWEGCPGTLKASNFYPNNLVILNLSRSKVTSTWEGWSQIKVSNNLKVLNLASCKNLIKTPDLSNLPNLEILILEKCSSLVRIDDSVKCLERLQCLNLKFCTELNALPKELGSLKALTEILMDGTSIRDIPNSVGHLVSLETLNASSCVSLTHLPSSISYLTSLSELTLDGVQIHELPYSIGELRNLQNLSLKDCRWMKKLPESIGKLQDSLIQLDISGSGISEFPSSIQDLQRLKVLKMNSCFIRVFPKSICYLSNLEELHASHCRSLESDVPPEIGSLHSLKILRLGYSQISSLPSSIMGLYLLQNLDLDHCNMLNTLPVLPRSLSRLCFNSRVMVEFPNLHHMLNLEELILADSDSEESLIRRTDFDAKDFLIPQLPKLKAMQLRHSGIRSIHGVKRSPLLRKLTLSCVNLKLMSPGPSPLLNLSIHHCHSLEIVRTGLFECLVELHIVDSAVSKVAGLGLLQALRVLNISKCQVVSLHGLDKLSSLVRLTVTHCQYLRKLPNLSKLMFLEELRIHCCGKLSEIHGLDDLIWLWKLEVTECAAANLPKVRNLKIG